MTDTPIADQLNTLLEAEREALLNGDFDRIADLMDEKQRLINGLEDVPTEPEEIRPLRDGLRRNQELFDQALAGLRNVAARLGDLNRARKSVNTYDSNGRMRSIEAPVKKRLERRA